MEAACAGARQLLGRRAAWQPELRPELGDLARFRLELGPLRDERARAAYLPRAAAAAAAALCEDEGAGDCAHLARETRLRNVVGLRGG